LIIDADPQATLTDVAAVRVEDGHKPILKVNDSSALNQTAMKQADETLIDIGTSSMDNVHKALSLADRVVVPVPPSQADIWSIQRFLNYVRSVTGKRKVDIFCFINRADTHLTVRETEDAETALISLLGVNFIKASISQRVVFRRSFSEGLAVFELEPNGKGTLELNALAAALYPKIVIQLISKRK
jgi:chromosome partitioning protein